MYCSRIGLDQIGTKREAVALILGHGFEAS